MLDIYDEQKDSELLDDDLTSIPQPIQVIAEKAVGI